MRRALTLLLTIAFLALVWPVGAWQNARPVRILARDGSVLYGQRGDIAWVSRAAAGEHVVNAVVAVEDRRFWRHPGIDPLAMGRALRQNLRSGRTVSGGSTLTMQAARLLRGSRSRRVSDKLAEALLAVRLEIWLTKSEILEIWLNRAYFGRGAYGIGQAAEAWFGKTPLSLTLPEAAYLAGLPQRPSRGAEARKARQRTVLEALSRTGALPEQHRIDATEQRLAFAEPVPRPMAAPHLSLALAGEAGAGDVHTTLDPLLQRHTELLARTHLRHMTRHDIGNVAAVILDNASGAVRVYLGSADYMDERSLGANDGVRMLRQPGSALKPFVYGTAFQSGIIGPDSLLDDVETMFVEAGAAFSAGNYDGRYHGRVRASQALASSFNVPAVQIADRIGVPALLESLRLAGFHSLSRPPDHYGVGLALGNGEVSLLELARAYSALARDGVPPVVHVVSGVPLLPGARGALDASTSRLLLDILSDPSERAPGFGRGGPLEMHFPMAAKTGTSKDYRDNWAVGVTPAHTIAVWAGNFDGTPMQHVSGVSGAGTLLHALATLVGGSGDFRPSTPGPDRVQAAVAGVSGNEQPGRIEAATGPTRIAAGAEAREEADAPTGITPGANTRQVAAAGATPGPQAAPDSPSPEILYPVDGMIFQLDPVLRTAYQRLHVKAAVPAGHRLTGLLVDGEEVAGALLPLSPGIRSIVAVSHNAEGLRRQSPPVSIRILPAPTPIASDARKIP